MDGSLVIYYAWQLLLGSFDDLRRMRLGDRPASSSSAQTRCIILSSNTIKTPDQAAENLGHIYTSYFCRSNQRRSLSLVNDAAARFGQLRQ